MTVRAPGYSKYPSMAALRCASQTRRVSIRFGRPIGALIIYVGPVLGRFQALRGVRPDGSAVEMPDISTRSEGERHRFLPRGEGLIYMEGTLPAQDFWLLDLATRKSRQLTRFTNPAAMRTFDITPDGKPTANGSSCGSDWLTRSPWRSMWFITGSRSFAAVRKGGLN
jgi:hypothetical protein